MSHVSDEALMMRVKEGHTVAFDLLFERHRAPVFNFIYRMLNADRNAAEDLLQEIFVKAFAGRDFYEPKAKFSTWLFTIARNHCINFLKSRRYSQAQRTVSMDVQDKESGISLADQLPARENQHPIEQREEVALLEKAVETLPDKYREIFLLRAVEGLSHDDISRILKLNPATVRTDYHRARMMMKKQMEGACFNV